MSELVETPEGKGRITGAAEVLGDWRVHVELSGGGNWTGLTAELLSDRGKAALEAFRREMGDDDRGPPPPPKKPGSPGRDKRRKPRGN